jgi:Ca2+-binding EF-hand superfamily protein
LWQKIKKVPEEEFLQFLDDQERTFYYQSRQWLDDFASRKQELREQLKQFLRDKECRTTRQYLRKALSRAEKEGDREEVMRILRLLQDNMQGKQDAGTSFV